MKPQLPFSLGIFASIILVSCSNGPQENKLPISAKIQPTPTSGVSSIKKTDTPSINTIDLDSTLDVFTESKVNFKNADLPRPGEVLSSYLPEVESYEIDPNNEVIITTKDQVQLHFEALSFVDEKNQPVKDSVKLSIQTFDSNLEFAAGNLTTQTVDGQILETGGMFKITASSNSNEVFIHPNKPYELAIPIQEDQDMANMHTYYGEQVGEQIRWVDSQKDKNQPICVRRKKCNTFDKKYYLEIANRNYNKVLNTSSQTFKESSDNWSDWLQNQDISGTNLASYLLGSTEGLNFKIKFGKDDDLIFLYDERKIPKNAAIELASIIEDGPKIDWSLMHENDLNDGYELTFLGTNNCKSRNFIEKKINFYKNENKESVINEESTETLDAIVLKVNKLGYINCDHSRVGRDKVHVFLPLAFVVHRVWLIFKDKRIALSGKIEENEVHFENLPKSNDIYIVALGNDQKGSKMTKLKVKFGQHVTIKEMHSFTYNDLEKAFE